jgi:hypothetical protein
LHVWYQLTADGSALSAEVLRERWTKLADYWHSEMEARQEFNQSQFNTLWDLRGEQQQEWFPSGTGLKGDVTANGEFNIDADGDRVVRGIHPAGVFTHGRPTASVCGRWDRTAWCGW